MAFIHPTSLLTGSVAAALLAAVSVQAEEIPAQPTTMADAVKTVSPAVESDTATAVDSETAGHVANELSTEVILQATPAKQPVDVATLDASAPATDEVVSTSADSFFAASNTPEAVAQSQDVAQVTRPLYRGVAPFYVGVGGNIGIVDSDESAIGDFGFNIISKISLGPRFSVRPTASFSEEDVSVAIPLTYNFNPLDIGQFDIYPSAGVGIDIGDDIGLLVNGGIDVPISRQFTVNGQVNWRATNDIGLGVSLGVAYNFPFFFE